MTLTTRIIKPGLLVSLNTTVRGNVSRRMLREDAPKFDKSGAEITVRETETTVRDKAEHEAAIKIRGKICALIRRECSASKHGLLCRKDRQTQLDSAIETGRRMADEFNRSARFTRIAINVIVGEIVASNSEADRAIASEMREHVAAMADGLHRHDVDAVRDAANRAHGLTDMLDAAAAKFAESAIDAARGEARKIKAGRRVLDDSALAKLETAKAAFDLDAAIDAAPLATPARDLIAEHVAGGGTLVPPVTIDPSDPFAALLNAALKAGT